MNTSSVTMAMIEELSEVLHAYHGGQDSMVVKAAKKMLHHISVGMHPVDIGYIFDTGAICIRESKDDFINTDDASPCRPDIIGTHNFLDFAKKTCMCEPLYRMSIDEDWFWEGTVEDIVNAFLTFTDTKAEVRITGSEDFRSASLIATNKRFWLSEYTPVTLAGPVKHPYASEASLTLELYERFFAALLSGGFDKFFSINVKISKKIT